MGKKTDRYKKTYVFDRDVVEVLSNLKRMTGKSETQLIIEAIELLETQVLKNKKFQDNLELLLSKIEELSYKVGMYEEKIRELEEKLKNEI